MDPTENVIVTTGSAITPRTKLLLLNSPSNPTGAVYPRELLQALAELAIRHNFYVVSDEVYEKLTFEKEHMAIASLPGLSNRTAPSISM